MPRPSRYRRICSEPAYDRFAPEGIACGGRTILTVDEYETIRLIDLEQLTQEECARRMEISRTTAAGIYSCARRKLADSIVNGRALVIAGGHYRLCDGSAAPCGCSPCRRTRGAVYQAAIQKGANEMRIAVTYENGTIFQHFGHTEQFKLYDAENGQITREQLAGVNGSGHGALASLLSGLGVDALICGGIGGGAQQALAAAGIQLYGGVTGSADEAVRALLSGTLSYQTAPQCSHHGHGGHGHAHCGESHHGCSGSGHC